MSPTNASCHATALSNADGVYALTFELHNAAADPVHLQFYEPFLQFEILATTAEGPVEVHQPALDIAVSETSVAVPAGGTAALQTPVRLRIREGAEAGSDGLLWTVQRRPESVSLQVRLQLPEPFDVTCPLLFE